MINVFFTTNIVVSEIYRKKQGVDELQDESNAEVEKVVNLSIAITIFL